MRKRDPMHVSTAPSREFGLEVQVNRSARPAQDSNAANGETKDGTRQPFFKGYREVIPPGQIGSEEGSDPMEPAPQSVETVAHYRTEEKDPTFHESHKVVLDDEPSKPLGFEPYAAFQPRSAPMPRAVQDNLYLRGYGENVADPRMMDEDSDKLLLTKELPDRVDLYGANRDGVLHNEPVHPGFKAVEAKVAKEPGIRNPGAVVAAAARNASAAAHKANPRLNKVRG